MILARFLRVQKNASGLVHQNFSKRTGIFWGCVLALSGIFTIVFSTGEVFAAAAITKERAYNYCKGEFIEFNERKNWVKYKKGYKCVGISWSDSNARECQSNGKGKISTKEDGKFNCLWPDGFMVDPENPEELQDVEKVYGASEIKEKCVGSSIIVNKTIDGKKYFCEQGEGAGVYEIILIVVNILFGLVGVLGVVGLVISGVTYLTARDNVEQTARAKKRILQIVIGLAIFAVLYVGLQWLIPGGIFGEILQ